MESMGQSSDELVDLMSLQTTVFFGWWSSVWQSDL